MGRYSFDTHYGHSTLIDVENFIAVSWDDGHFNETQKVEYEGDSLNAVEIARLARELADYVAENYRDLI